MGECRMRNLPASGSKLTVLRAGLLCSCVLWAPTAFAQAGPVAPQPRPVQTAMGSAPPQPGQAPPAPSGTATATDATPATNDAQAQGPATPPDSKEIVVTGT